MRCVCAYILNRHGQKDKKAQLNLTSRAIPA